MVGDRMKEWVRVKMRKKDDLMEIVLNIESHKSISKGKCYQIKKNIIYNMNKSKI